MPDADHVRPIPAGHQPAERTGSTTRRRNALALARLERRSECLALCREELSASADGLAWLRAEIVSAMEAPQLTLAGELAAVLAALRLGSRWYPANGTPPAPNVHDVRLSTAKLKHDLDQLRYLRRRRLIGTELDKLMNCYEEKLQQLTGAGIHPAMRIPLDPSDPEALSEGYGRILHLADSPRLTCALSSAWNRANVTRLYRQQGPGIVLIDEFLSTEALAGVQRFALESTVWSGNRYPDGRLGAFLFTGWNCPLLLQIAEELREQLPDLIGARYPLRQLWGFKNTEALPANSTLHADFAAVNVNFWITPDSANLDPDSGGMLIYDVEAPPSWEFATYNERMDIIRDYLAARRPRVIRVPYRQNRAVIFNSDLFHETEGVRFRDDYESHRVNVTMLYGDRSSDTHYPPRDLAWSQRSAWRSRALSRARR